MAKLSQAVSSRMAAPELTRGDQMARLVAAVRAREQRPPRQFNRGPQINGIPFPDGFRPERVPVVYNLVYTRNP